MPLLDLTVLRQLEEELGDSGVARSFVTDYIGIWDKRLSYLERSVEGHDVEQAMDALISVKISALMVGASRLARLAVEAECLLRARDLTAVRLLLPDLAQTGEETVIALKIGYL